MSNAPVMSRNNTEIILLILHILKKGSTSGAIPEKVQCDCWDAWVQIFLCNAGLKKLVNMLWSFRRIVYR